MDFINLLEKTQQYISAHYAAALTNSDKISQLKTYIEKYLRDFESSDENNTFSLEFLDDKDLNTYHFFKAYTEYHNARKRECQG